MHKAFPAIPFLSLLLASLATYLTIEGTGSEKIAATAFLTRPASGKSTPTLLKSPPAKPDSITSLGVQPNPILLPVKGRVGIIHKPIVLRPFDWDRIDNETLWLARGIFSETKRAEEQELVAWVIRNRVETRYRGKRTYEAVVRDPFQFSAFNPGIADSSFYSNLSPWDKVPGWKTALTIAHNVRYSHPKSRPFSMRTRHFFSEQSMTTDAHPEWSMGAVPVRPERPFVVQAHRFRFYEDIN